MENKVTASCTTAPLYNIKTYEKAKVALSIEVVNKDSVILEICPYRYIEGTDLAMYVNYVWSETEEGYKTTKVTKTIMEFWKVDKDTLINDAIVNSALRNPISLRGIGDVLNELADINIYDSPFIVCRSKSECNYGGSRVFAYPTFKMELAEKIGMSCYILPSSIHELLIIPNCGMFREEELKSMVINVNETELSDGEVLSNNVFYFDIDNFEIKTL